MSGCEIAGELMRNEANLDVAMRIGLTHALDRINDRSGCDSALIGMLSSQGRSFSGTKIAFTRIPDVDEFLE